MPCPGSLKSADSTMLSCLSPRSPCCGPNAAAMRTPAAASASSECASSRVTEAGCASSATRRPASGFASARSPTSRSMPNFIELERERLRMVEVRLAGRVAQRPVRKASAVLLDHRRQADAQLSLRLQRNRRRQLEALRVLLDPDHGSHVTRRHSLAITVERIARPFARRREIEFAVAGRAVARDEELAAGMLPEALGLARPPRRRNAQPGDLAFKYVCNLQFILVSQYGYVDAGERRAGDGGMARERSGRHGRASLSWGP